MAFAKPDQSSSNLTFKKRGVTAALFVTIVISSVSFLQAVSAAKTAFSFAVWPILDPSLELFVKIASLDRTVYFLHWEYASEKENEPWQLTERSFYGLAS